MQLKDLVLVKTICQRLLFSLFGLFISAFSYAQDTVFVKTYSLPEKIVNIDGDGRNLIVRTDNHLYKFYAGRFDELKFTPKENDRFTWISKNDNPEIFGTYSTLQFPESHQVKHQSLDNFVPGYDQYNMTEASMGNLYYLAYNGILLEYRIHHFYSIKHRGKSIRHIYHDDNFRVIATYAGIFIDSTKAVYTNKPIPRANFASGETTKIDGQYYLNSDPIYRLKNNQWEILPLKTDIKHFKKLLKIGKQTYFQSTEAIGWINLNKLTLKKIITHTSQFHDMENLGNLLLLGNANGKLYLYDVVHRKLETVHIGSSIYDITIKGQQIILSCNDGLYEFDLKTKKSQLLFRHKHIIQSIFIGNNILFTSFEGLFLYTNNHEVFKIIDNVEFNKRALNSWNDLIYAGSTEGLYVINLPQLINEILPSLDPEILNESKLDTSLLIALGFTLVVIIGSAVFIRYKNQGKPDHYKTPKVEITPERIREDMLKNEHLISVESIAEYYQISRVHLNRVLKKHDKNTLELIKQIKQEIVLDLKSKQTPIEKISQRVGYTSKYIKQHFLKK
ncbi:helix-turn-helix transcriptional regulator [Aquirufa salirivi]|uniref:HTH araC/xylS-type domain-containing protein n=1 Tax=Aquirufa salirivi TaxID=3104729 RepID=A0ABW8RTE3_9BACT